MFYEHSWSLHSLIAISISGLGMFAIWPFRRKEAAEMESASTDLQENEAPTELDHLDWGIRLGMLERYERAAERLRMAVKADPDDGSAQYNLALALDLAGHHEEAMALYTQIVKTQADILDVHVNLALTKMDLGDCSGAVSSLRDALQLAPDDAIGHYDLGCVYMAMKQWSEAAGEFQSAVNSDPKDAQTRFNYAIALRRAGNDTEAERELRDFVALARARYPEQRAYAEELLRTYGDKGDSDAA